MNTIVFSRFWNPANIDIALRCAKRHAPDCRIVHICDGKSKVGWENTEDYGDYFEQIMEMLKAGEALWGENPKMFEKVCVARWFVLLKWMQDTGTDTVCHCDSDNLWFDDPFKSPHYIQGKPLVSWDQHACISAGNCIVTMAHVESFCAITRDYIKRSDFVPDRLNDIVLWGAALASLGGYSDQNVVVNGVAFDHHMGWHDNQWEIDAQGYKKLVWMSDKPYCYYLPTAECVRLLNLHCWCAAEDRMGEFAKLGGLV
jgi:hypothetical protein